MDESAFTENGVLAIAFVKGIPTLFEVVAVTGKRAKVKTPGSPMTAQVSSLPIAELYAYNKEVWESMSERVAKIKLILKRMSDQAKELEPFIRSIQKNQEMDLRGLFE